MELFDKKFVYFMWDDALKGKKVFVADYIDELCSHVEEGYECDLHEVVKSADVSMPFQVRDDLNFTFAYYDPNYEVKRAFYKEGKQIQVAYKGANNWVDCDEPEWVDGCQFRVKPECPCEDGIDSKACVGCEHSEDGKQYRPYRDALEFIADYGKRFPTATPRPMWTMPLIWIAHKTDGTTRLIVEFSDRSVKIGCKVKPVDFGKLFEYWTYLDGSPVGKEC